MELTRDRQCCFIARMAVGIMHKIQVSMTDLGLAAEMRRMRRWLDDRCFDPRAFHYQQHHDRVVVLVAFAVEHEARAFALQFNGWNVVE